MRRLTVLLASAILAASPATAGAPEDFKALTDDYWAWSLKEDPTFASSLGVKEYDDRLRDISLEASDRRARDMEAFLARLKAIPDSGLSVADRVNKAILLQSIESELGANRFGQRMMIFTNRGGWHQGIAGLADALSFTTAADYNNYLKRLAQYPALNDTALAISTRALEGGYTRPCVAMVNFEDTITGVIPADAAKSRLYAPFAGDRPAFVATDRWTDLQSRARALIDGPLRAAYAKHLDWYLTRYKPKCNAKVGASALPGGKDYYAFRVRDMTTTDMSAEEIHQLGQREVARIRGEMETVAKKAGFASREAMIADMRTNPKFFARTGEELMQHVARETKRIDGFMPGLFATLPRLPYTIREIPAETAPGQTTAYYDTGNLKTGLPGVYWVNTSKLDQRPLWEIPALSVHEAVPGHHQQLSIQQEVDLPEWRRFGTFFTAFVEGWGLYSERLGIEMGLYDTPQKDMGRLGYEMWRATRLVVDTGIHAKDWSKDQAVAFMKDNTTLTDANIDAEVNRYIANPAQALAYKIGELKIRALRALAERELGARFDLRRFHDAVLLQGAVPLEVLDRQVKEWIAAEKARG